MVEVTAASNTHHRAFLEGLFPGPAPLDHLLPGLLRNQNRKILFRLDFPTSSERLIILHEVCSQGFLGGGEVGLATEREFCFSISNKCTRLLIFPFCKCFPHFFDTNRLIGDTVSYFEWRARAGRVDDSYQIFKKHGPLDHLRFRLHISFRPGKEIHPLKMP